MVVSVMVPFFPVVVALCVLNIRDMLPLRPYDYNKIHKGASPYTWNSIIFLFRKMKPVLGFLFSILRTIRH